MSLEKIAAEEAAKLVKETAESTAMALNMQYIQRDIQEIKQAIKDIALDHDKFIETLAKLSDTFVKKEEFIFWRNLLVSGMLLTITLGIIVNAVR